MKTSILCPIKETMVYPSVCEKDCTYSKEKCEEARAKRTSAMRPCLECKHDDDMALCEKCLGVDGARTRPYWEPKEKEATTIEAPKSKPNQNPEQLSLFG